MSTIDKIRIGATLRELRGERKREEVALAVGVTAQAISMYETGQRVPTDDMKVKLAEYFEKNVQEIFYD